MDYDELLQKFNLLLNKNDRFIREISRLRAQLGLGESEPIQNTVSAKTTESEIPGHESACKNCLSGVDRTSDSLEKIRLFMSLFKGRDDVYAKRWENINKGTSGYSPVCLNQWQPGMCGKPKIPCSKCKKRRYAPLNEKVKKCIKHYGMIIADECHHASAFTYEHILKTAPAKYVYGLTATPTRKDGHHPILFMHCGPIRYRDDPKKQAENRPFDHYIVPRFTSLRIPLDRDERDIPNVAKV